MKRILVCCVAIMSLAPASAEPATGRVGGLGWVQELVLRQAVREEFPPEIALAVAKVESDFRVRAVSPKGAIGVMQVMPRTARREFGVEPHDLYNAHRNIQTGIRFLKRLRKTYGRMDIALSHYNGGSGVRTPGGELRVLPYTRDYVDNVLAQAELYRNTPLIVATVRRMQLSPGHAAVAESSGVGRSPYGYEPSAQEERSYIQIRSMSASKRAEIAARLRELAQRNKNRFEHGAEQPPALNWRKQNSETPEERKRRVRRWESVFG